MYLESSPVAAHYAIKRAKHGTFISKATMPPRLCSFTTDVTKAEMFELESEANTCAEFIKKYAFDVVVVDSRSEQ